MKTLYKSESFINKDIINDIHKELIEKKFIINFFEKLPVESLKKLINFKEFDFENKKLLQDSVVDEYLYELLSKLKKENSVKYICEIYLDIDL